MKKEVKVQIYYYVLDFIIEDKLIYICGILSTNKEYLVIKEYFKYNVNI